MKTIKTLLLAFLLFALPAVVHAQFTFITNADNTITITGYTGTNGDVTIPDTTNGYPVTSIEGGAFEGCFSLTNLTIPDSVTSVGDYVCYNCINLTNVTLGNGVTSIGSNEFGYCNNLITITMGGSLTNIGYSAFWSCFNLANVTIPKSVTSIGGSAFYACPYTKLFFQGNLPQVGYLGNCVIYYLPGTIGWDGLSGAILWNPQAQTSDANFGVRTNRFGFNITGTTNIPIIVEACTNLGSGTWVPLQSVSLTNGSFYFNDPQWTNYPSCFYRIRSP